MFVIDTAPPAGHRSRDLSDHVTSDHMTSQRQKEQHILVRRYTTERQIEYALWIGQENNNYIELALAYA